jgi:hypothetical protein
MNSTIEDAYFAVDLYFNETVEQEIQQMADILDGKCKKANLTKVIEAAVHLSSEELEQLYKLLISTRIYSMACSVSSPANHATLN